MSIFNESNLDRFVRTHNEFYHIALSEIKNGQKVSHWMWYIFPQLRGLVEKASSTSQAFSIADLYEAKEFLSHPLLSSNLKEISSALLELDQTDPHKIFKDDDKKLLSCMTLFSLISPEGSVFHQVLEKYYDGKRDEKTLELLKIK